jgi:hypothetical protein
MPTFLPVEKATISAFMRVIGTTCSAELFVTSPSRLGFEMSITVCDDSSFGLRLISASSAAETTSISTPCPKPRS